MIRILFKPILLFRALKNGINKTVADAGEDLLQEVRRRSPVGKTGKFKRSWRMSGMGTERRVSNSQSYGHALEHGRSGQAPEGVVGPSLRTIQRRR